jgi:hypothetical protein
MGLWGRCEFKGKTDEQLKNFSDAGAITRIASKHTGM